MAENRTGSKKRKEKGRRPKGDGAVYQITDGSFRANVTLGYDAKTGRRIRKYVRGKSESEVRSKLRALLAQSSNRLINLPERVTVEEWLTRFAEHRATEVRESTRANHRHYLAKLVPSIGRMPLRKLTAYHVRDLYKRFIEAGLSPSVRQHVHDFLKAALRDAERMIDGYRSPMGAIDRPKGGRVIEPQVWEAWEAQRFLETVRTHRLYGVFYFTLTQGLRIGEVLGLRWTDLEGNVLRVQRTVTLDGGRATVGPPKTDRGYRTLYLKEDALEVLRERQNRQRIERDIAERWGSSEYIFSTTVGTITYPNNVRRLYKKTITRLIVHDLVWNVTCLRTGLFHRAKAQVGVRYIRIHDQRHTYTTTAREAGVDLEVLADRLGQDPRVTAKTYSHVTESRKRGAALSGEELYGGGVDEQK